MSRKDELIDQYRQIHERKVYGRSSEVMVGYIQRPLDDIPKIRSVLDFGCGQSRLVDWIGAINDAEVYRYDPAIPEFADMPIDKVDLVLCTDVMEHVPEEDVDDILATIRSLSKHAFFNISVREAKEILPNGENAHCTVRPPPWWRQKLLNHFRVARRTRSPDPTAVSFLTWREASA